MNFYDLLNTMTWYELISFSVAIIAIIFSIGWVIVFILKKAGIISVTKMGIQIGKTKDTPMPPHATCVHSKDIISVLSKQAEMINKVRDIKHSIIPHQMKHADTIAAESKGMMQKAFINLMENMTGDTGLLSVDYHTYRMCLRFIHEDLREYFREAFRDNHMAEKTEAEFQDYVERCTTQVIQLSTDLLNDSYRGQIITREMIYKENMKLISKLEKNISDIFHYGRNVAIKSLAEIHRLEDDFNNYLKRTIG